MLRRRPDSVVNSGNRVERRWRHGVHDDVTKVGRWWLDVGRTVVILWRLCVTMVAIAWYINTMQPHSYRHLLPIKETDA